MCVVVAIEAKMRRILKRCPMYIFKSTKHGWYDNKISKEQLTKAALHASKNHKHLMNPCGESVKLDKSGTVIVSGDMRSTWKRILKALRNASSVAAFIMRSYVPSAHSIVSSRARKKSFPLVHDESR